VRCHWIRVCRQPRLWPFRFLQPRRKRRNRLARKLRRKSTHRRAGSSEKSADCLPRCFADLLRDGGDAASRVSTEDCTSVRGGQAYFAASIASIFCFGCVSNACFIAREEKNYAKAVDSCLHNDSAGQRRLGADSDEGKRVLRLLL